MSQGDLLIFINVVSWIFFFFFLSFFFFFGNFLPAVFKSVRVQFFFGVFVKQQFFSFFSNFYQKLVWYLNIVDLPYINKYFLKNPLHILRKYLSEFGLQIVDHAKLSVRKVLCFFKT